MALVRKLDGSILANLCKYAEELEVPGLFALWSGIASVSACLGRNCFIDQGYFVVYPNTYIILVAGSARSKKSTAIIELCYKFLQEIKSVKLLSQKMTPEALIKSLSGASAAGCSVQVLQAAVGSAVADELATFVNRDGFKNGMIDVLTKLYDCQDFPYETVGRGIESVRNPCLSVYGGITMERLRMTIPMEAIGSGFTSRIVFVYKERSERLVPWPELSQANKARRQLIVNDLNCVAQLRGPFVLTPDARKQHDIEYVNFAENSPLNLEPSLFGYVGRRDRTLLKIAMVVSAAKGDDRVISLEDFNFATTILREAESQMTRVFKVITAKEVGDIFERIIAYLMRVRVATKASLVGQFRHWMTAQDLHVMMQTLEQEGVVRVEVDGSTVTYSYVGGPGK